jgi:hypothetical protein
MMNMRSAAPAQSTSQMPPPAAQYTHTALQSQSHEAASFVQATPSYSRRDNATSSNYAGLHASDASRSPWTTSSSAAGYAAPAAQQQHMFTPSAAASAVATPLWSRGGGRADHNFGMSFASQMETTGGHDESSELLKQQYVALLFVVILPCVVLMFLSDTRRWCRRRIASSRNTSRFAHK